MGSTYTGSKEASLLNTLSADRTFQVQPNAQSALRFTERKEGSPCCHKWTCEEEGLSFPCTHQQRTSSHGLQFLFALNLMHALM